jgi:hypothetical protein
MLTIYVLTNSQGHVFPTDKKFEDIENFNREVQYFKAESNATSFLNRGRKYWFSDYTDLEVTRLDFVNPIVTRYE